MTATTSRRAVLAGVAAAPALSLPAIAAKPDKSGYDPAAALARVKEIVNRLETRVICNGWKPDREGNARLVRYYEWAAANPEIAGQDASEDFMWTIHYLHDNGQSIDWVWSGDAGPMICHGAATSSQMAKIRSAHDPIYSLIEQHRAAVAYFGQCLEEKEAIDARQLEVADKIAGTKMRSRIEFEASNPEFKFSSTQEEHRARFRSLAWKT